MSNKIRPLVEIQQEYTQVVIAAGEKQYMIVACQKDLDALNVKIAELHAEGGLAQEQEKTQGPAIESIPESTR